jgi:hypothetical protein
MAADTCSFFPFSQGQAGIVCDCGRREGRNGKSLPA